MVPLQVRGANALGLPVVVTEQYPKALGSTVPELAECLNTNTKVRERLGWGPGSCCIGAGVGAAAASAAPRRVLEP